VAGLKLFVRTESLSALGDGAPVNTWPDESGHSVDLVQAASGSRPVYSTNVDGAPAVAFDGVDDVLATAGNVLSTDRHTIFVVAKPLSSDENDLVGTGGTGSGHLLLMTYVSKIRGHVWRSATLNVVDGATGIGDLAFAIFEQEVDASRLTIRLDGSDESGVALAGVASGASRPIYLGSRSAGFNFSGYVRALLVYEGNPTSVEKDHIRNYLISKCLVPIPYPVPSGPNAPSGLNAEDNVTYVSLTWLDNSTDEDGFRVYRNDVAIADLPAGTVSWDDTNVVVSGHYTYYVVAYNGVGESAHSSEVIVVVGS
jgi:hypothetical protein